MPCFSHNTDFCYIQQPTTSKKDGFYIIHHMLEFRRDHQELRMPSTADAHIHKWVATLGAEPNEKLRNDFHRIQHDIVTIIIKDVVEENGMLHGSPVLRADVRTRIGLQRQDMTPFMKLGCILPDMDEWTYSD